MLSWAVLGCAVLVSAVLVLADEVDSPSGLDGLNCKRIVTVPVAPGAVAGVVSGVSSAQPTLARLNASARLAPSCRQLGPAK